MDTLHWRDQGLGERVLRVWLGGTFTYAGIQKLTDPGFFRKGSVDYIGTQLHGFATGSPIAPLLHLVGHFPVLAGAGVALTEILLGVATLAGVGPAVAATVGALLSVSLWLSASWHVHPYFLGSDSIYAVAWVAYLLMLPSVRARLAPATAAAAASRGGGSKGSGSKGSGSKGRARANQQRDRRTDDVDDQRRHLLRGGAVVLGGLALGGVAGLVGRSRRHDAATTAAAPAPAPSPSATGSAGATSKASPSASAAAAGGAVITSLAALRTQGAVGFRSASAGPAVVVSLGGDKVAAYSRTCTHAGCAVDYDPSSRQLVCPCHDSVFDPAAGGRVVNGPAPSPLPGVAVVVDPASGEVRQA